MVGWCICRATPKQDWTLSKAIWGMEADMLSLSGKSSAMPVPLSEITGKSVDKWVIFSSLVYFESKVERQRPKG
jgi:hypothetical protein